MKVPAGQVVNPQISVRRFMEILESLRLELLAGKSGLDRQVGSPRIQKPGLALAGVHEFVHGERIQILGQTEISFLERQTPADREAMLRPLFEKDICLFLVTKGLRIPGELIRMADETRTPLLRSSLASSLVINRVTDSLMDVLAPRVSLHGVLLDVYGVGLLLIGESSVGKSESALELVVRGHRLVADDMVEIRRRGDILTGRAPKLIQYHMELRGIGVIDVRELFGVVVDVDVPYILLPVAPARNVTVLLEVAVRNLLLKRRGIHSARAFLERRERALKGEDDGA
ncbi:MAG: HPr(Ser) kinase/phosphatase [Acidobacteriota bacterium]